MLKLLRLLVCTFGIILFGAGAFACETNQIDVNGDGTNCVDTKFSITTTNMAADTGFKFEMSATGTFYVDCGDGGTLSGTDASGRTISRHNTSLTTYTCTYSTAGIKTIRMAGSATSYYSGDNIGRPAITFANYRDLSCKQIAAIDGSLGAIFSGQPKFIGTFENCSNLTSIPESLFDGVSATGVAFSMFESTFRSCTGLTQIPENLFDKVFGGGSWSVTNGTGMFYQTFQSCTGLTSLPENLFKGVSFPQRSLFVSTFAGCTGLKGYIPASMFSGLINDGSQYADFMMDSTFYNTGSLATSCPSDTHQVVTGYESYWSSHVACVPKVLEVTLNTDNATSSGNPSTIYAGYNTAWYSDAGGNNVITNLGTLPTKTGLTFGGFYTGRNATGEKVIDENGNFLSSKPLIIINTTLYAYFETGYNVTYSCGDGTGTAPANAIAVSGGQFITSTYNNCSKDGYMFTGWALSDTNDVFTSNSAFTWNYTENKTLTAQWEPSKFTITTTNLSANTEFKFNMSSVGTFYVDWGDGNMDIIIRNASSTVTYSHTYTSAGVKTIKMTGLATAYSSTYAAIDFGAYNYLSSNLIASIDGSLGAIFPSLGSAAGQQPQFYMTFYGCTNLTSIPEDLFDGIYGSVNTMFFGTFFGCTGLTSIPEKLFDGVSGAANSMFGSTFYGCTGLTSLPEKIFDGVSGAASGMFQSTFSGCTGLTSIPEKIFDGVSGADTNLFRETFSGCTGLTSIPEKIFDGVSGAASRMFQSTFSGCTGLTSIPEKLFDGVSGAAQLMFYATFQGCTGLTSIPEKIFDGVSGAATGMFQSTFSGCTGVTSIPEKLFDGVSGAASYMFEKTFYGCSGLTSLPEKLFSGVTGAAESTFSDTFYGCSGLTGWIPPSMFDSLIFNGSPTAGVAFMSNMFFGSPNLATSCPTGKEQVITGYESQWMPYVACSDASHTITYELNGGTNYENAPNVYWEGLGALINGVPTKDRKIFAGWCLDSELTDCAMSHTISMTDTENKTFYAKWEDFQSKFTITTKNLNANTTFSFKISAMGTFYVDWGDGYFQVITRTNTIETTYSHKYTTAGVKIIGMSGIATGYLESDSVPAVNFTAYNGTSGDLITSVDGSLGAIFPTLGSAAGQQPVFVDTFRADSNLTSISENLFSGVYGAKEYMFKRTFAGCSKLTSIPENLFSGISGAATEMFYATFASNSSLTSIPEKLFSGVSGFADLMFVSTFDGCTGLKKLPKGLFSGVSGAARYMFNRTFYNCTGLTGYIPPSMFSGLINNGSPDAPYFMTDIFYNYNTNSLARSSCPTGTTKFITGYESYWSAYIACAEDGDILKVDLDTTDATTSGNPSTVYVGYNTAWYSDANGNNTITNLGTLPTKTGFVFGGFYTGRNATVTRVIDENGNFLNTTALPGDTTLYAYFGTGYNVTYSCGDGTGTAPASSTAISAVPFTPETHGNCTKDGYIFTGWAVSDTDDVLEANSTFIWNYTENKALTARWEKSKFSITTTNIDADTELKFRMSAMGTFYVDWGDGTVDVIKRTGTTDEIYSHKYATAGIKTIHITGLATGYRTGTNVTAINFGTFENRGLIGDKVASINGSLGAIFPSLGSAADQQPQFYMTFYGCTNLTSIPEDLFDGIYGSVNTMFSGTFFGCTGLTSIPEKLFDGVSGAAYGMFLSTFYGCTGLTSIPEKLFDKVSSTATNLFRSTFSGCTGLTSIPEKLFSRVSGAASYMFSFTFSGCSGLTSLPEKLFSGVSGAASYTFNQTFSGCTGLTGYIPPSMFSGLINNGSPNADNFMTAIFDRPGQLATSCPTGTTQAITGYESYWNSRVACVPDGDIIKVDLDTTDATTSGNPSTVYVGYNTAWYSDANGNNTITNLGTLPTKTGFVFGGFYTGRNATGTRVIDENGNFLNTTALPNDATLYAYFGTGYNVTYSCGDGTGTAPASSTAISAVSFTTAISSNCTKDGYMFAGWAVSDTDDVFGSNSTFTWDYTENKTLTARWEKSKFSITTTNLNASTEFKFALSAMGTFYVDWGDGTVEIIKRTGTTDKIYSHKYATAGVKTITMSGVATEYTTTVSTLGAAISFSTNRDLSGNLIASVDGSLGAIFPTLGSEYGQQPRFMNTFYACSNLTSVPEELFRGVTGAASSMFESTFSGCSGLTSIPEKLFDGVSGAASGMFQYTFYGCTGLTSIPEKLFDGISGAAGNLFGFTFQNCANLTFIPEKLFNGVSGAANSMFRNTFSGCRGLTSIPENLFSGVSGAAEGMFNSTFYNCRGLTSLPANLFSGVTGAAIDMFNSTFYYCNNLTGYIPASMFSGLINSGSPTASSMMSSTFYNTGRLATSCPVGSLQVITGYESSWYSHVACEPAKEPHPITYVLNGGTNYEDAPTNHYSDDGQDTVIDGVPTKTGQIFAGWCIDSALTDCAMTYSIPDTDLTAKTFYAKWLDAKFTITTTNMSANNSFYFNVSAAGNFIVDCGVGGTLYGTGVSGNVIVKTDTTNYQYSCWYPESGIKTIRMTGTATGYSSSSWDTTIRFSSSTSVASLSGSLGAVFPTLGSDAGFQPNFAHTFNGASNLTSIPETLFNGVTGCNENMFYSTFYGCSGLTRLPENLFRGITCKADGMFNSTFYNCRGLTGYIPPSMFIGLLINRVSDNGNMMNSTFYNTGALANSCPADMEQYMTGYENYWSGHVACYVPIKHSIIYELNGAEADDSLPTTYDEGFGTIIDYVPNKEGSVLLGWCTDSELTDCALPFTISESETDDITLYAKWSECRACATTNASCEMEIIDNACVYTTICDDGFDNILHDGEYNAACIEIAEFPINYELDGGTNYVGAPMSYWSGTGEIIDGIPSKANHFFGGWCLDSELTDCSMEHVISDTETGAKTLYAKWISAGNFKFMVKTDDLAADSSFYFVTSASGTFTVDWGDGTAETIERDNNELTVYSHTYTTAGEKIIRFGGLATGYATPNVNQDMTQFTAISFESQPIVAVDGSLGAIFPTLNNGSQPAFVNTFADCYSLTKVPDALFSGVNGSGVGMFAYTFAGTGIKTLPLGLFNNITGSAVGMFAGTFMDCEDMTTIPAGIFRNINSSAEWMFGETFSGAGISTIPETLFSSITTGAGWMFEGTFMYCQNLEKIPENLFASITTAASGMFEGTFSECYNLQGYIPSTTFAGLIANNSPYASDMFYWTFGYTDMDDYCPTGSIDYITNYEQYWDGYVACETMPTHAISYELNGGTNYEDAPTFYWETVGEIVDGIPTKKDSIFSGWCWDSALTQCDTWQYISENEKSDITLYAKWLDAKFSIKTDVSNNSCFYFTMSAKGSFVVDWGDGEIETIQRSNTNQSWYEHCYNVVYNEDGPSPENLKTIRFGGLATGYYALTEDDDLWEHSTIRFDNQPIVSINGSLGAIFPTLGQSQNQQPAFITTFSNCYNLTSIPSTLFNGVTGAGMGMFMNTFNNTRIGAIPANLFSGISGAAHGMFSETFSWTYISSIPENLFSGVSGAAEGMFDSTFSGTQITSIPANLFSGVSGAAGGMFNYTFSNTQITSIPENLFSGVSGAAEGMFDSTFVNCNNLTSIPENLFSGVSGAAEDMFNNTFSDCYNLTSIPENLFSGVSGAAEDMFNNTFNNCYNLKSIPENLFSGVSGAAENMFDSTFNNCYNLTSIPGNLFSGVSGAAPWMFNSTFSGTQITSIPENLFSGVSGAAENMFNQTFNSCYNLKSIPENLFSSITTAASYMFNYTFAWCNNLTGYIPPSTFAGLIENDHQYQYGMFNGTFDSTNIFTSCPAGTQQYETGYEDYWNNRVSCEPTDATSEISYELNGGTNFTNAPDSYQQSTGITIDGIPTKPGFLFAGWCWDSELTDCSMSIEVEKFDDTDITLYAKWVSTCECAEDDYATCTVSGPSEDNKTCLYVHTCDDGYWNENNGQEIADSYLSCDQCSSGSYCPTGATSEISCSTVGDGSYIYSYEGSSEASGCYRDCMSSDVPHSRSAYNQTYYGDNGEYCGANDCVYGYHTDYQDENGQDLEYPICKANVIQIIWSDATPGNIDATHAASVTYDGVISTPRSATRVPGKRLKGWRFVNPLEMPAELVPAPEPQLI